MKKYFFLKRAIEKITGVIFALVFLVAGGFLIQPALADCSTAACSATPGKIDISWDAAPATSGDCNYSSFCGYFAYYVITYNGVQQTTVSPSISINVSPNTVYSWSVDAFYSFNYGVLSGSSGYSLWVLPSGTFDTTQCSPASCTLTPPTTTINAGGSATLTWSTINATSADMDNGVYIPTLNGSVTVSPVATTLYTLTVSGPRGSGSCSATVTVISPTTNCSRCSYGSKYQHVAFTSTDPTCYSVIPSSNPVARTCDLSATGVSQYGVSCGADLAWYQANCFSFVRSCTRCSYATPNNVATFDTNTSDCYSQADTTINRNAVLTPCSITNGTATCPSGSAGCVYACNAGYTLSGSTCVINTYPFTVIKSGGGSGTVTSADGQINCGSNCSASYNYGASVTLTAAAAAGSSFTGWGGACSGSGACVVTIDAIKSVTATFVSATCSDSDNGQTFYVGGSVTYSGNTYSDSCLTGTRVNEYFCEGSPAYANFVEYECPVGCDSATRACRPIPTVDLKVNGSDNPSAVSAPANLTVSWTTTNAENFAACVGSGQGWNGSKSISGGNDSGGNLDGLPAATYTYSIVCNNKFGSGTATDSVTIVVSAAASTPAPPSSNNPPSASGAGGGSVPTVSQPNYCVAGPAATFAWSFYDQDAGDTQSAYQLQVATNPGFSGPGTVLDTGKIVSVSSSYAMTQGVLVYNQNYYWRVRVWDNHDAVSSWASGASFTTPEHQYPTVSFSWSPQTPNLNEAIQITDQSTVFGGATKQSWLWVLPGATYLSGTNSFSQNPQVKFSSIGNKTASLAIMDSDGYSCSNAASPSIITVRFPLPGWREVAP